MISAPTNFNHISHMGPGDGIQNQRLLDLPTTLETADQACSPIIHSLSCIPQSRKFGMLSVGYGSIPNISSCTGGRSNTHACPAYMFEKSKWPEYES